MSTVTDWATNLPSGWAALPLRRVASVQSSSVDKLSSPTEVPVRLCNYVDVYRNDRITADMEFMVATATRDEVARFRLRMGDVLITKDSESWTDIAVPALVQTEADDLVCGYHLSMLRPYPQRMTGGFLARALRTPAVASQLQLAAKGVTRYGLSQVGIKAALIPAPPLPEQDAINRYLDHAEVRIASAISAKRKMVALLDESAAALRWDAIVGGPSGAEMLHRGAEWMGALPSTWNSHRLKSLLVERDDRTQTGTETLLSLRMREGLVRSSEYSKRPQEPSKLISYKRVQPGMLVMNRMRASIGLFGIASEVGLVSPDYATFEVRAGAAVHLPYLLLLLKSAQAGAVIRAESRGMGTGSSGFLRIYTDRFGTIRVVLPEMEEQERRSCEAAARTQRVTEALNSALQEIRLLQEYRSRLVSDVVSGRRILSADAATLPDMDPRELGLVSEADVDDGEAVDVF